ncbi:class I SAM-dependent methyltransferase [Halobellus rufus]|uniref:class I SAM-dependent methyltransferase n=1 Tax=Halobellus rufus TaxID=1448860 RepID=UPI0006795456|nr:class I SAM-dependent methyltransferase [Halobellus rufus]
MNSHDVRRAWADRSGAYSPEYYAYHGPNETSDRLCGILDRFLDRNAAVLELGCSSGRHLASLYDLGFENLSGIDINDSAFEVMESEYPELAAAGTFYRRPIEDVVVEFDDDEFDAVYSVETLQHIHPESEWVFEELARITSEVLVTVENEGDSGDAAVTDPGVNYVDGEFPLYYRDWNAVFTELGFAEIEASVGQRDTVRTFRAAP